MKVKLLSPLTQSDIKKKPYVAGDDFVCKTLDEALRMVDGGIAEHSSESKKALDARNAKEAKAAESEAAAIAKAEKTAKAKAAKEAKAAESEAAAIAKAEKTAKAKAAKEAKAAEKSNAKKGKKS